MQYESSAEYRYFTKIKAYRNYHQFSPQIECSICLQPLNSTQSQLKLLHCGHLYHKNCIKIHERNLWRNNDVYDIEHDGYNLNSMEQVIQYINLHFDGVYHVQIQ